MTEKISKSVLSEPTRTLGDVVNELSRPELNREKEQMAAQSAANSYELDWEKVLYENDKLSIYVLNDHQISFRGSLEKATDSELKDVLKAIEDEKLCGSKDYVDGVLSMVEKKVLDIQSSRTKTTANLQEKSSTHLDVETYEVQEGDSLWKIARKLLSSLSPTENDVGNLVDKIIRENKEVIGDNPDLIYAGQVLKI